MNPKELKSYWQKWFEKWAKKKTAEFTEWKREHPLKKEIKHD